MSTTVTTRRRQSDRLLLSPEVVCQPKQTAAGSIAMRPETSRDPLPVQAVTWLTAPRRRAEAGDLGGAQTR